MSDAPSNPGCCDACGSPAGRLDVPENPVGTENVPGRARLRYRVGVHGTFKESMLDAVARGEGLRAHTSRGDDSAAVALLDACAVMLEVVTFYAEVQANEGFLSTAVERRSVLELARGIGYELKPGVAASTALAFEVQVAPGMPETVEVPAGTQVQSLPVGQELPQTFETLADVVARPGWNRFGPVLFRPMAWEAGKTVLTLSGTGLRLSVSGRLVIQFAPLGGPFQVGTVAELAEDYDRKVTRVTLAQPLAAAPPGPYAAGYPRVVAFAAKAAAFGAAAPDWRSLPAAAKREVLGLDEGESIPPENRGEWPGYTIHLPRRFESRFTSPDAVAVLRASAGSTGAFTARRARNPLERALEIILYGTRTNTLSLDQEYPDVLPGSLVYLDDPAGTALVGVAGVETVSRSSFGLSGKSTVVRAGSEVLAPFRNAVRTVAVHAGSRVLPLAEETDPTPVEGDTFLIPDTVPELAIGQRLALEGRDAGDPSAAPVAELVEVRACVAEPGRAAWRIQLARPLALAYARDSVVLRGNLADATHGAARSQILGHGDARARFARYALPQKPLTHVSSPTAPGGAASTLVVRVDGVAWQRVDSFYGRGPDDEIYTLRIEDDGTPGVRFGDGRTGRRPPSGINNLAATFRVGLGVAGNLPSGRLVQLASRPLGLTGVAQPFPAAGGEDPEAIDDARANAPLAIRTLDRLVSLSDYADYSRAFAGIAKARAVWAWFGEDQGILVSVAGPAGAPVGETDATYRDLVASLERHRDRAVSFRVVSHAPRPFAVTARLRVDDRVEAEPVIEAARARLLDAFSFARRDLGQAVASSDILASLHGLPEIVGVDLDAFHRVGEPVGVADRLAARVGGVDHAGQVFPAELLTLDPAALVLVVFAPS